MLWVVVENPGPVVMVVMEPSITVENLVIGLSVTVLTVL